MKHANTSLHQCETNPLIACVASCLALEPVTNLNLYLMFGFPKVRTNSIARLCLEPPPLSPGTSPGRCYLRTRTPPTVQHVKGQVSILSSAGHSDGSGGHCKAPVVVCIISRIFTSVIKLLQARMFDNTVDSIPAPTDFDKGGWRCVVRQQVL